MAKLKNPVTSSPWIVDNVLGDEAFAQELLENDSSSEAQEAVWQALKTVHLDARRRQLIWPDGKRLTFSASSQRLRKELPQLSRELIESHIIGWIEMGYEPEGYSEEQMEQFEDLTGEWADTLTERLDARTEKQTRTRDS